MDEEYEDMDEEQQVIDDDLLSDELEALSVSETKNLIDAIRKYLNDEEETPLEGRIAEHFTTFKNLSNNYKSIFLFIFQSAKKEDPEISGYLAEINSIFQKKHIMMIFNELNSMPTDVQYEFYDSIYIDIAPRYEYFLEKKGLIRK